jgi:uncharacterized protein YdhG (YjbR/CyaY superfamily)
MSTKKATQDKPAKSTAGRMASSGLTAEERAAMQERVRELKAGERLNKDRAAGERALLEKVAEMPEPDRSMATRIHEIVTTNAPELMPKTWYGMPAYARDGKVVCFFQNASKFDARYATFGFSDTANLDHGDMWATAFAVMKLTVADEKKIAALVKKAVN